MTIPIRDPDQSPRRPARPRAGIVLAIVGALCVTGLVTVGAVSAGLLGQTPGSSFPHALEPTLPPAALVDESDQGRGAVDARTMDWLTVLQGAVAGDPRLGAVAISPDRTTVTITWYGDPSTTLQQQITRAPDGIRVVLQPAAFARSDLDALIRTAMTPGLLPGIQVTMGGAENHGSGLRFGIWELPADTTLDQVAHQIAAAISRPDIPVTVEIAQIVPAQG